MADRSPLASARSGRRPSTGSNPEEALEAASIAQSISDSSIGTSKDKSACSICNAKLGKRHLTPRHTCRICCRAVCSACSPNSIQVAGQQGQQRACTECVVDVEKVPEILGRLVSLGDRLRQMHGVRASSPGRGTVGLEEAMSRCETAVSVVEEEQDRAAAAQANRIQQLEAEARIAKASCVRFTHRLHGITHTRAPPELESAGLGEALAHCEAALSAAEVHRASPSPRCCPSVEAGLDDAVRIRTEQRTPLWGDAAQSTDLDTPPHLRHARCCCRKRAIRLWVLIGTVILLGLLVLGIVHWVTPGVAQKFVNAATITLLNATLSDPMQTTVRMRAHVVLDNAGPISAQIHNFQATMYHEGKELGRLDFPAVTTVASGPTKLFLDTEMHVTDPVAFTAATARILQGYDSQWDLRGNADVHVLGLSMQLAMAKSMQLPATSLIEVRSYNIDILNSTEDSLTATADTSFFSASVLQIQNFGSLTFALHPVSPDGELLMDVELGHVTMPNFQVTKGANQISGMSIIMLKTPENEQYQSSFLSKYVTGQDQLVAIRGPIGAESPFLNNITTQVVHIIGLTKSILRTAYVSGTRTITGHVPETGKPCSLVAGEDCMRGAVITVGNTLHHELVTSNLVFDVSIPDVLDYDVKIHELFLERTVSCNKGTRLTRMVTAPGMWSFIDPNRSKDDKVVVPAAPRDGDVLTSYFMNGFPQPGQEDPSPCFFFKELDPMDCCFTTIMTAAACYYKAKGLNFIPISLKGNMSIAVGNFSLPLEVSYTDIPVAFAEDIPNLVYGPITISCSDYTFY